MTTGRASIHLLRYRPLLFISTIFFRGLDDLIPFFDGLIKKAFFDALDPVAGGSGVGLNPWTFVVALCCCLPCRSWCAYIVGICMGALALRYFNAAAQKPDDRHHEHVGPAAGVNRLWRSDKPAAR